MGLVWKLAFDWSVVGLAGNRGPVARDRGCRGPEVTWLSGSDITGTGMDVTGTGRDVMATGSHVVWVGHCGPAGKKDGGLRVQSPNQEPGEVLTGNSIRRDQTKQDAMLEKNDFIVFLGCYKRERGPEWSRFPRDRVPRHAFTPNDLRIQVSPRGRKHLRTAPSLFFPCIVMSVPFDECSISL